jgi:hypothetical protein
MKKLTINAELRDGLKNVRKKLGPRISDARMSKVVGGYCGGTCYITCAWYCRGDKTTEEVTVPDPPIE